MGLPRLATPVLLGIGLWLASNGRAPAQTLDVPPCRDIQSLRQEWERRVIGGPRVCCPDPPRAMCVNGCDDGDFVLGKAVPAPAALQSMPHISLQPGPMIDATPGPAPAEPVPADGLSLTPIPTMTDVLSGDYSVYSGDCCEDCAADYEAIDWQAPYYRWLRDLSLFAGVHGFKGPVDQGRNGNFGIHEGFNFGAPLVDWPLVWLGHTGVQAGVNAVHSNFSGDQAAGMIHSSDRNQFFFTGGIFHRSLEGGYQNGIVFDLLYDNYYTTATLRQIRSDSSLVLPGGKREIGYFGAYGTGGRNYVLLDRRSIFMEPADVFALYYRRYFEVGGDGRVWIGYTGRGDGVVGAELRAPLGHQWALENRFNYLIPKHSGTTEGAIRESWALTIELVWYPGQPARCVRCSPYRPMLSVADNALFMTNTFITGPP